MDRIVDTSVFCGYWPFRALPLRTPGELKLHLARRGVTRAWVSPAEAILYPDPMEANEPLFTAIAGDDFFLPVGMINVTLATWRRDAGDCLVRWGCRALKLAPNYHQYELASACVDELVELASEAGAPVCIQLRMMDERAHHPLMKVPGVSAADIAALAARHRGARFLACGAYQTDLNALREAPNVWVEISFVESGQALRSAVEVVGWQRLVFGSHSPFFYFEAAAAKLDVDPSDIPPEQLEAIRNSNASALLGTHDDRPHRTCGA